MDPILRSQRTRNDLGFLFHWLHFKIGQKQLVFTFPFQWQSLSHEQQFSSVLRMKICRLCTLAFARTRRGVCEVSRKIMRRFLRNTKIEWKLERCAPRLAEYKVYVACCKYKYKYKHKYKYKNRVEIGAVCTQVG